MALNLGTKTETLNTLYTSTWYANVEEIIDQVEKTLPLFAVLTGQVKGFPQYNRKGLSFKSKTGGRQIQVNLRHGRNSTANSYGQNAVFPIVATEKLGPAYYDWKNIGASMMQDWEEIMKNRGSAKIFDLVDEEVETCRVSLYEEFNTQLFADGTGNGSQDINGLANLISSDGTGTVGELAAGTYSWWANQYKNSSGPAVLYLTKDLGNLINTCNLYKGSTTGIDLLISDQTAFEAYDRVVQDKGVFDYVAGRGMADLGIQTLRFKGIDWIWDSDCTSATVYALNTSYLQFYYDPGAWFDMTPWKDIPEQLDKVAQIICRCNLTTNKRRALGRLNSVQT